MKQMLATLLLFLTPVFMMAEEEVSHIYKKIELDGEAIAVNRRNRTLEDVEYILVEVSSNDIKAGKHEVEVTRIDTHLYWIEGTDFYIKMPFCLEIAFREKAVLNISDRFFHLCGTLTWGDK